MNQNIKIYKENISFGSCACGEVRSSSDVDFIVVTARKISDRALAADIRWPLDEPINGIRTDVAYKNEESTDV